MIKTYKNNSDNIDFEFVELIALGGYGEWGRNHSLLKYKNHAIFLDCGVSFANGNFEKLYPDLSPIQKRINLDELTIHGLFVSHGHLDHIGGINGLVRRFPDIKIYSMPYTLLLCGTLKLGNKQNFIALDYNETNNFGPFEISQYEITHSIPQSIIFKIKINDFSFVYFSDFKIDEMPNLGNPTRLYELKEQLGVVNALAIDTTRARLDDRVVSEVLVRHMLEDLFAYSKSFRENIFIACFASNVQRIKSIAQLCVKFDYKLHILGGSFPKYILPALELKLITLKGVKFVTNNYDKYLNNTSHTCNNVYVISGSQGEPGSVLYKLANKVIDFNFSPKDVLIFSSSLIPQPSVVYNRTALLNTLASCNVEFYDNIHASGHAGMRDHLIVIDILKPVNLIPTHSDFTNMGRYLDRLKHKGYDLNKNYFILPLYHILKLKIN